MKIRVLAWNTFASLLRNRLIVLFCGIFICVLLLSLSPILAFRAAPVPAGQQQSMVMMLIGAAASMASGFGSLLAAWSAADTVATEMKSGTILAVMARPVRRWEFLLGKWLGVQMLMAAYVILLFGFSFLLAGIGGEKIQSTLWPLLVYPMIRYAIYSALAILLVTLMHPVFAFVAVLITSVLSSILAPQSMGGAFLPEAMRRVLYYVLPSMNLLSESRFLTVTQANLNQVSWSDHLTAVAYGLNWALVFFLLAVWSFRHRPLSRD